VVLVVKSDRFRGKVEEMLKRAHTDTNRVSYIIQDTNRSWMRDSGPVIIKNLQNDAEALHFQFNSWAKYRNYNIDRKIPEVVASYLNIPLIPVVYQGKKVVLEGGAIDINGTGSLITTEECLMDQDVQVRNPGFSKKDYENVFMEYLGVRNVLWLGRGIEGDDTHGHVDDICRFVNRNTVVAARETNRKDKNHPILEENLERLQDARLENNEKIHVVTIPMPGRIDFENLRLPASYINFIYLNGAILVPVFNDKKDYIALGIFNELFPDREVLGIHAVDLVWGLGTLHCLSREIPA
jgi:agmatine deiminase